MSGKGKQVLGPGSPGYKPMYLDKLADLPSPPEMEKFRVLSKLDAVKGDWLDDEQTWWRVLKSVASAYRDDVAWRTVDEWSKRSKSYNREENLNTWKAICRDGRNDFNLNTLETANRESRGLPTELDKVPEVREPRTKQSVEDTESNGLVSLRTLMEADKVPRTPILKDDSNCLLYTSPSPRDS